MRNIYKSFVALAALVVVVSLLWFAVWRTDSDPPQVEPHSVDFEQSGTSISEVNVLEKRPEVFEASETDLLEIPEPDTPENLNPLLPAWMVSDGDLFHDSREIDGQTVLRSRGRYQWENGSSLEIEITDVGIEADDTLIKALGFDLELEDLEEPAGFKWTQDEDGMLVNQEYDYADQCGSLQILMSDRYLVEIQIEQMEPEAFQEILDTHIPFDELFKRLASEESGK